MGPATVRVVLSNQNTCKLIQRKRRFRAGNTPNANRRNDDDDDDDDEDDDDEGDDDDIISMFELMYRREATYFFGVADFYYIFSTISSQPYTKPN